MPSDRKSRRAAGFAAPLSRAVPAALVLLCGAAGGLRAQGAVDPNVAPRAATLERQGERPLATELLGRYLATAPDDGRAWLLLGRFYLTDVAQWHARGHTGDPDGSLLLDFAGTALDQAGRLAVDSAVVLRNLVEMQRDLLVLEDSGWAVVHRGHRVPDAPPLPDFVVELGTNLLGSCANGGVLLTGGDLETLAVWHASVNDGIRPDVVPLRPDLYATDARYRGRMATALHVDSALAVQQALASAARHRAVCLAPGADSAALPGAQWTALRLVRVNRPDIAPTHDVISVTALVRVARQDGSVWLPEIRAVYYQAARYNRLLCQALVPLLGDSPPDACR